MYILTFEFFFPIKYLILCLTDLFVQLLLLLVSSGKNLFLKTFGLGFIAFDLMAAKLQATFAMSKSRGMEKTLRVFRSLR